MASGGSLNIPVYHNENGDGVGVLAAPSLEELGIITGNVEDSYAIGPIIGRGKFAVVYRAVRKRDGTTVALKRISLDAMDPRTRDNCLREIRIAQTLDHVNIIRFLDGILERNGAKNDLVLVLEYADAGDLKRQLRKLRDKNMVLDEFFIWRFFSQIAGAVAYMHGRRILHRDLKPANIFITVDGVIKIGDLGLGRLLSDNTLNANSKVGTPLYMSPEVIMGRSYERGADVWSCGCILYELAMQRSPFKEEGLTMFDLYSKITTGTYPALPETFSAPLRDLVTRMLQLNPKNRPTMDEIATISIQMRGVAAREKEALAAGENKGLVASVPAEVMADGRRAKSAVSAIASQESGIGAPMSGEISRGIYEGGRSGSAGSASAGSGSAGSSGGNGGNKRPASVGRLPAATVDAPPDSTPFTPRGVVLTPSLGERGGPEDGGESAGGQPSRGTIGLDGAPEFDGAALTAFRQAVHDQHAGSGGLSKFASSDSNSAVSPVYQDARAIATARPSSSFRRVAGSASPADSPATLTAKPSIVSGGGTDGEAGIGGVHSSTSPHFSVVRPQVRQPQNVAANVGEDHITNDKVQNSSTTTQLRQQNATPHAAPPMQVSTRVGVRRPGSSASGARSTARVASAPLPQPLPAAVSAPAPASSAAGPSVISNKAAMPSHQGSHSPPAQRLVPPATSTAVAGGVAAGSATTTHSGKFPPAPQFRRRTATACVDLATGAPLEAAQIIGDTLRACGALDLVDSTAAGIATSRLALALPPSARRHEADGTQQFDAVLSIIRACLSVAGLPTTASQVATLLESMRSGALEQTAVASQLLSLLSASPVLAPTEIAGPSSTWSSGVFAVGYGAPTLAIVLWLSEFALERAGGRATPLGMPLSHVPALRPPVAGALASRESDAVDENAEVVEDDAEVDAYIEGEANSPTGRSVTSKAPVPAAGAVDPMIWRTEVQRSHASLAAVDRALAARVTTNSATVSDVQTTTTRPQAGGGGNSNGSLAAGGIDWRARFAALQRHAQFAQDATTPDTSTGRNEKNAATSPVVSGGRDGGKRRTAQAVADYVARCRTAIEAVGAAEARWNRMGGFVNSDSMIASTASAPAAGRRAAAAADAETVMSLIAQHKVLAARQRELQQGVEERTARVAELEARFARLVDDVEIVTEELETRAARLSSTSQLQVVRAALASLRRDAQQLDVVIGVSHQQLMQKLEAQAAAGARVR